MSLCSPTSYLFVLVLVCYQLLLTVAEDPTPTPSVTPTSPSNRYSTDAETFLSSLAINVVVCSMCCLLFVMCRVRFPRIFFPNCLQHIDEGDADGLLRFSTEQMIGGQSVDSRSDIWSPSTIGDEDNGNYTIDAKAILADRKTITTGDVRKVEACFPHHTTPSEPIASSDPSNKVASDWRDLLVRAPPRTLLSPMDRLSLRQFIAYVAYASDDLVESVGGLDALMMLKFLKLGAVVFFLGFIFSFIILVPINATGNSLHASGFLRGLDLISLANIPEGSHLMIVHACFMWIFSFFWIISVRSVYSEYYERRLGFLRRPRVEAHTVMFTGIPSNLAPDLVIKEMELFSGEPLKFNNTTMRMSHIQVGGVMEGDQKASVIDANVASDDGIYSSPSNSPDDKPFCNLSAIVNCTVVRKDSLLISVLHEMESLRNLSARAQISWDSSSMTLADVKNNLRTGHAPLLGSSDASSLARPTYSWWRWPWNPDWVVEAERFRVNHRNVQISNQIANQDFETVRENMKWQWLLPRSVDLIDWASTRVITLEQFARQLQKEANLSSVADQSLLHQRQRGNGGVAFVTFQSAYFASCITSEHRNFSDGITWVPLLSTDPEAAAAGAPSRKDLIWSNIRVSPISRAFRHRVVIVLITIVSVFWFVLVAVVQGLVTFDTLVQIFPSIGGDVEFQNIFEGFIPGAISNILMVLMGPVLMALGHAEGTEAKSVIHGRTLRRYFGFLYINGFLAVVLFGSTLKELDELISHPAEVISVLGRSVPAVATFFCNYIASQSLIFFPLELIRFDVVFLGWCSWIKVQFRPPMFSGATTRVDNADIWKKCHQESDFAVVQARSLLVILIATVFISISPIVAPFASIYCFIGYCVFKQQVLFCFDRKFDRGGCYWPVVANRILVCLITAQIVLAALLSIKLCPIGAGIVAPLPFLTGFFWLYSATLLRRPACSLSSREAMAIDRQRLQSETFSAALASKSHRHYSQPSLAYSFLD